MISEACTRHAHKPLSENLPACRRRGGKFRVFSAFFEEKPGNRRLWRHYFAISGRSCSSGTGRPDLPADPAPCGATLRHSSRKADDGGIRPLLACHLARLRPAALGCWRWPPRAPDAPVGAPARPGEAGRRRRRALAVAKLRLGVPRFIFRGLNAGGPPTVVGGPRPNDVPAVTYSPTPSRVQYHRRCGS